MSRNSGNIRYSERRPYDSGRNPRLDRERRAARKRRRRNRLVKGLIAWAVCILLVVLVAFATMRVVGNMSTSKQRELRAAGIEKLDAGDFYSRLTARQSELSSQFSSGSADPGTGSSTDSDNSGEKDGGSTGSGD